MAISPGPTAKGGDGMGHKTLIGGTAYDIKGGKTLIGGTGYDIKKGVTLIGGTGYDISFGVEPLEVYAAPNTALSSGLSFTLQKNTSFKTSYMESFCVWDYDNDQLSESAVFTIPVDFTAYSTLHINAYCYTSIMVGYVGYAADGNDNYTFEERKSCGGYASNGWVLLDFDISALSGVHYIKGNNTDRSFATRIKKIYLD